MKLKNIWVLCPIVLAVSMLFIFKVVDNNMRENVIRQRINTTVTSVKINFIGGGKKYLTKRDITIPLPHSDTLLIGDSIAKEANSNEFNVYRKTNGNDYQFVTTYKARGD